MGASRNAAEEILLEETIGALRNGGTVLIPADAGGRILEMMLLLEEAASCWMFLHTPCPEHELGKPGQDARWQATPS